LLRGKCNPEHAGENLLPRVPASLPEITWRDPDKLEGREFQLIADGKGINHAISAMDDPEVKYELG
jgi:hypothetical protein